MKTLHRLYISPQPIDTVSRDLAARFLSIPNVLKVENSYRTTPEIFAHLTLESDADIDERSIRRYVAEPGFHNIHLVLTPAEWEELGLRPSLYGQSRVVDGQIITYGAWEGRGRDLLTRYSPQIRAALTEETLGEWHELDHGVREVFGINDPTTHAAFYGYSSANSRLQTARRWVRKPYPTAAWEALPWHRLPEQTPKRVTLIEILTELLQRWYAAKPEPRLTHPVEDFKTYISRGYGVRNAIYTLTGVHIGADYRTPVGTPVRAPANGEVTASGYSKALGNFCYYRYTHLGEVFTERWLHLKEIPARGRYTQDTIIARTGNTGMSTGPHFHHDIWRNDVDLTIINKKNWDQLTVDPQQHYV